MRTEAYIKMVDSRNMVNHSQRVRYELRTIAGRVVVQSCQDTPICSCSPQKVLSYIPSIPMV